MSSCPASAGKAGRQATLVSCHLETGRTHQIRVHMAAIGHPVAGDERYGIGRRAVLGTLLPEGRLFLHAGSLAVDDPATGDRLSWESPLPPDLGGGAQPQRLTWSLAASRLTPAGLQWVAAAADLHGRRPHGR